MLSQNYIKNLIASILKLKLGYYLEDDFATSVRVYNFLYQRLTVECETYLYWMKIK